MSWAIQVEHLSKAYRLGRGHGARFDSFHQVITDALLSAAGRLNNRRLNKLLPKRLEARPGEIQSEHMLLAPHQFDGAPEGHFWALKEISLRIDQGQRVGIIGRNGSGKSTLLKILSRITRPTSGKFQFRGHLISLLEVGTGFHPDLTGRENVFLNAKINGMTERKIRSLFEEIVDFSEIGIQIDMPIRRYSSGMYMRLAFSVAAFLESEILVVDEVLAVGDVGFQKKCLDKMIEIGNSGRTLLFVSHDMDAVKKICDTAVEISNGQIVEQKPIEKKSNHQEGAAADTGVGQQSLTAAIADYSNVGQIKTERAWPIEGASKTRSRHFAITGISLRDGNLNMRESFSTTDTINIVTELTNLSSVGGCFVRIDIETVTGRAVLTTHTKLSALELKGPGRYCAICRIDAPFFNPGLYRLNVFVADEFDRDDKCLVENVLQLQVEADPDQDLYQLVNLQASLRPEFAWKCGTL